MRNLKFLIVFRLWLPRLASYIGDMKRIPFIMGRRQYTLSDAVNMLAQALRNCRPHWI